MTSKSDTKKKSNYDTGLTVAQAYELGRSDERLAHSCLTKEQLMQFAKELISIRDTTNVNWLLRESEKAINKLLKESK